MKLNVFTRNSLKETQGSEAINNQETQDWISGETAQEKIMVVFVQIHVKVLIHLNIYDLCWSNENCKHLRNLNCSKGSVFNTLRAFRYLTSLHQNGF